MADLVMVYKFCDIALICAVFYSFLLLLLLLVQLGRLEAVS